MIKRDNNNNRVEESKDESMPEIMSEKPSDFDTKDKSVKSILSKWKRSDTIVIDEDLIARVEELGKKCPSGSI